jgi:urease accessory protein
MFDSELPSELTAPHGGLGPIRADSHIDAEFAVTHGVTHVARLFEAGSMRVRFPRGPRCEAVLLNTGGGIAGGDRITIRIALAENADVVATSQAAEKLYRSDAMSVSRIDVRATLAAGARLSWMPQEAILFDGARVDRSLEIDMAARASLTLAEAVVFGRSAHGEILSSASWRDRWRIRRDGKLLLAENVAIDGAITRKLERPAVGGGAKAVATIVHVAPDAEDRLAHVRGVMAEFSSTAGCSAWNGMLVIRFVSAEFNRMRMEIAHVLETITGEAMPRAWSC